MTGYKLVGLGACTEWIRAGTYYHWVIAQRGQLGRCPRLAGIPPPEGPMTPPSYPPVTASGPTCNGGPGSTGGPASNYSPASDGGWPPHRLPFQIPHREGADDPEQSPSHEKGMPLPQVSKAPPGIQEVLGTPPAGVAEQRLESPVRHGVAQRSITGPSPGGGIPGRRLRSPSRIRKADFRPSGRYMKRPENINWPLR